MQIGRTVIMCMYSEQLYDIVLCITSFLLYFSHVYCKYALNKSNMILYAQYNCE